MTTHHADDLTPQPDAVDRRAALHTAARLGAGIALGLPLAFSGARRARAQDMDRPSPLEILNYALTLEYLEADYYQMGLDSGVIPAETRDIFALIGDHEADHVGFLQAVIEGLGGTPVERPTFDFTAGGMFDPFNDYGIFLALSQGFEDTGVRAYKGQAANIPRDAELDGTNILTAALQIHSVEARHAAMVRRLRGPGNALPDAWIAFDRTNVPALEPVYAGEDNVTHAGINLLDLTDKSEELATESFDEPLTMDEVLAIAGLFITDTTG